MLLMDKLSSYDVMKNKEKVIMATDDSFCIPKKGETCYDASGISAKYIVDLFK